MVTRSALELRRGTQTGQEAGGLPAGSELPDNVTIAPLNGAEAGWQDAAAEPRQSFPRFLAARMIWVTR